MSEEELKQISDGIFNKLDEKEKVFLATVHNVKNKEIERLKDLCNKYEEEHNTAFKLWTQKMEEMPDYEEKIKLKKEVDKLNNIIEDKKERIEIAIRLLIKMFGTDDYEINYVMGVLNGDRQIHFEELKENNKDDN